MELNVSSLCGPEMTWKVKHLEVEAALCPSAWRRDIHVIPSCFPFQWAAVKADVVLDNIAHSLTVRSIVMTRSLNTKQRWADSLRQRTDRVSTPHLHRKDGSEIEFDGGNNTVLNSADSLWIQQLQRRPAGLNRRRGKVATQHPSRARSIQNTPCTTTTVNHRRTWERGVCDWNRWK